MRYNLDKWWDRRKLKNKFPGVVFIKKEYPYIEIRKDCNLMYGAIIYSGKYPGTYIGNRVLVAPYAQVRENAIVQTDAKIGAKCNIEWEAFIGERTNIQGLTMVAEKTWIGQDCFLAPGVIMMTDKYMAGGQDPIEIGHGVKIGGGVSILPGTRIRAGAIIGAGCVINGEIPAGSKVFARPVKGEIDGGTHGKTYMDVISGGGGP